MEYRRVEEVAREWGLTPRRVQLLCAEGAIAGAVRFGRAWMIPEDAKKPADRRRRESAPSASLEAIPMPRKTPFLYMTDLYSEAGSADRAREALANNPEAQLLFDEEIAYSRGEIDRVYEYASFLLGHHSTYWSTISAGVLLALCAIWRGDLDMWRKAKLHISEAPASNDHDRDLMELSITAVDSMLYDVTSFPEWFKIGCFEPVGADALPVACVFYAKYLYATAYAVATRQASVDGLSGLTLMGMLPNTIEPMISHARANGSIVAETYLRLTCAAVYHASGRDDQALRHIDRALELALPDRFYGLLAEYCRTLDNLLRDRISRIDPLIWERVKSLYKTYNNGWSRLSGSVRGKTLVTTLSVREREVAKLAAFGLSNAEISQKLHISLSGVKQAIRIVSEKTGMRRDEFAAVL
ncbi:MAG: hypothetical protein IJE84_06205 [Clostridia bacterium]|nr:hypothetical protein [Clostridia bacterium]